MIGPVIRLNPNDNVVVARVDVAIGTPVPAENFTSRSQVPAGYKIAARRILKGEPILKYNTTVGFASADIEAGAMVHSHNTEFREFDRDYAYASEFKPVQMLPESERATFQGYVRPDGRVGTRNFIGLLSTVNCSATVVHKIAEWFTPERLADFPNVDGVVAFSHSIGCGMEMSGEPMELLRRTMAGYARHPNLAAALIVVPFGQGSIVGFSGVAAVAIVILWRLGAWYKPRMTTRKQAHAERQSVGLSSGRVKFALVVLVVLCFSKAFYLAGINSYYTFFLIHKFGVSTQTAQIYLFVFLAASACGVFFGGPLGDRFGRKYVIWFSIVGALPFTLMLPYASLTGNLVLSILIGFIISSAMPAIIVYAQELMPHRFGMISGLFFGFVFGIGGIGAAVLGYIADRTSIDYVYQVCAFLPAIGLLAVFLPQLKRQHA